MTLILYNWVRKIGFWLASVALEYLCSLFPMVNYNELQAVSITKPQKKVQVACLRTFTRGEQWYCK